ncbi:O-antigen ligase [Flexibacter flexilis DSM 6793]|uniref:O-antigen ligase n=1 Tax=Flexibacter flexilis DSM 6793 TaxID=927664 RepID=A0A1I1FN13_9BACT|nr:O-antigen ligase family protein [Flexibacter flexilis]SFB98420.1 O-antigen ligase [Flexibacter flexilis DSM 6793]
MKQLLIIDKIQYWLLLIVAFTIPLPKTIAINSISIVLLVISVLIISIINKSIKPFLNKNVLILLIIFLIYLISGLWSEDKKLFLFEIEKKLSLFFFPIIFSSLSLSYDKVIGVLKSWILGTSLLLSICLFNLARNYFNLELHTYYPDYYVGEGLVFQTGLHRVYIAHHFIFTIIILFTTPVFKNYIRYILGTVFLIFTLMLSSRITIISIPLILFIYITYLVYCKKISYKIVALLIVALFTLVATIIFVPKVNFMIRQVLITSQYDDVKNVNEANGVHVRYLIWKGAKQAIEESPFIGYGVGDSQKVLNQKYNDIGFDLAIKNPYNAHNQYIQTCLDTGFIGLFTFIAILAYLLVFAFKKQDDLYLIFLLIFLFGFFTENILSNQKGVVFFAFFNSMFYLFNDIPKRYGAK